MSAVPLLDDRVAIVAGGGRGNGAAIARGLAAQGARVAVVDLDRGRAEEVARKIASDGGQACVIEADLLSDEAVRRMVEETVKELGGLDVLVNNAGGMTAVAKWRDLVRWTEEDWDSIIALNLRYVFLTCRAAIPTLARSSAGAIVNVASMSGVTSARKHAAYGAAKAGLVNLTRSLAAECGPAGIRVNAVAPGVIITPANAPIMPAEEVEGLRRTIPLGRGGRPEDVANGVLFLASDLASYITGQTISVDGGATANYPIPLKALEG